MNKYLFIIVLLAALIFLPGASVWEGAAAVSMDFPESGLYVATNSFPRNTVVDLTNLETGKTVRVIVTAGLDTPGLLALVSREAADAIGLRSRTIGRIRMIAMQDPIAFSRFSDEYRSGDPDYDPLAAVEGVYGKDALVKAEPTPTDTDQALRNGPGSHWDDTAAVMPIPEQVKEDLAVTETPVDIYVETIVEDPVIVEAPPEVIAEDPVIVEAPPEVIAEDPVIVEAPPEVIVEDPVIVEAPPEVIVEDPVIVEAPPEVIIDDPVIVEAPPEIIIEDPVIVEAPPEEDFPETVDAIAMVSTTRDPMVTDLPEDTFLAPEVITEPPPTEPVYTPPPTELVYTPPPVEPVYTPPPVSEPSIPPVSGSTATPEYSYTLIPAEERPPNNIPAEPPPVAYVPPVNRAPQNFSAPSVLELESGKYYLQIGAYSHTPTVEMELAKIERGYPVTVHCITVSGTNVYRVLIGPVNQGEAGALLKKFQGRGYKDAFVRRG